MTNNGLERRVIGDNSNFGLIAAVHSGIGWGQSVATQALSFSAILQEFERTPGLVELPVQDEPHDNMEIDIMPDVDRSVE